jgi:hypothetical protein
MIPPIYRDVIGSPLRWQDDITGMLPAAVHAFFQVEGCPPLTWVQFEMVRDYAEYYVNAPIWDMNPHHDDETRARLAELRAQVKECKTDAQLQSWLHLCLGQGLDPF